MSENIVLASTFKALLIFYCYEEVNELYIACQKRQCGVFYLPLFGPPHLIFWFPVNIFHQRFVIPIRIHLYTNIKIEIMEMLVTGCEEQNATNSK